MRKFLNILVWIPLGLIFVIFAVANRHLVTVSLDPFNSSDPSLGFTMPLFAVIIAFAVVGVLAGGFATWFRQRHWRRAARQHEADAGQLREQMADLRSRITGPEQRDPQRLAAPLWDTNRRDKHGATL